MQLKTVANVVGVGCNVYINIFNEHFLKSDFVSSCCDFVVDITFPLKS